MLSSDKRRIAELLSSAPTFSQCDRDDLVALVEAGAETSLPSGWGFVQEGTPADACYVLLSGTARVFHGRHEIAVLAPGDIIGEMAFLEGGQRDATVTSSTPVKALRIEYDALRAVLAKRPHLKEMMVAVYNARRAPAPPQG
jgi:CRP/FNR family cyclic AMP-dependent transcriptional regulator